MHLHPNSPAYIMKEGAWETPFGELEIEADFASALAIQFPFQVETADNYLQDNTIEVQLPFIKYFFNSTKIVPMGVPPRTTSLGIGKAVAEISRQYGVSIRVIGSTDLTHYGNNYGFIPKGTGLSAVDWVKHNNDKRIIDLMLDMNPDEVIREALTQQNACCSGAAATAIAAAKQLGSQKAYAIAYANSYDKQPAESFVGYTGIVF
jgi:AmmeMemoRadiSam system protein B